MHPFFLVIVLSFHVGHSLTSSDSRKHGSHNLLNLERGNNSVQRAVRCTPCEKDTRPISNHLDPEYRGNGADNLGYDWSSMAWGGPAYPRRSKVYMGGMRGRDGRMMPNEGGRNQGNVQVVCDTCRSYWTGDPRGGGRGVDRGRQYDMPGSQNFNGGQPGYWQGDKMTSPGDYETRVMSPTVGVLVKPGSRIAYIPSRSGEMFWDGVSGGGTRWDGFSNGISWIGNPPGPHGMPGQEWDRSDPEPRDGSIRRAGDYPPGPSGFGPWDNQKRPVWGDNNPGRGYYFTNGVPNGIDPQWRDRGYASNWHYGSTNQNGWNGNNMKWNYGGKQWPDNDRAANRFYFNSPQDRTYGPSDGPHNQYGNQYGNYQPGGGYPASFRPQPSWPAGGSFRPGDRFPAGFQPGNYGGGDKDRPWDYTSRDPFGYQRPGPAPDWARPGPSYPPPGSYIDNQGKYNYGGFDKFSTSDKSDFERPWNRPSGYGPSKPGSSGGFPYGGTRYPEDGSGSSGRPNFSGDGHLFYPNDKNRQPSYPSTGSTENRPGYPTGNRKPGEYSNSGNQVGTFSGDGDRPSGEYPGDKRPSVTYTGGRPETGGSSSGYTSGGRPGTSGTSSAYPGDGRPGTSGASSGYPSGGRPGTSGTSSGYPSGGRPGTSGTSGGYPGGGSSTGGYPSDGSSPGGYPSGGSTSGGYPTESSAGGYPSGGIYPGGSRPSGYPRPSSEYPSGGSSYPSGGSRPVGYPSGGSRPGIQPDNYYGGGDPSGGYPSGGGSSYPRPSGYPGGGTYPGGSRPGYYPDEGFPNSGYYGGSLPTGYPGPGRPGGYPGEGNRPDGFISGSRPLYPIRGPSYPGGPGGIYPQGGKNPQKGYYTGFITELSPNDGQYQYGSKYPNYFGSSYPGDKNFYPGNNRDKYFNGASYSNEYPSGGKNRYPAFIEDRYSGGGGGDGGGGGYAGGDGHGGGDRFYYGQSDGKGKYPMGYPSNHRFPNGGGDEYDRNQSSSSDKNTWNYGQNERKDGIYRRSGGSYPPYRGGQYYTSSYLASMSTTAGSTLADPKTQDPTKADEVTQPTSDSS